MSHDFCLAPVFFHPMTPNHRFERTGRKRRLRLPSRLRRSAAAQAGR